MSFINFKKQQNKRLLPKKPGGKLPGFFNGQIAALYSKNLCLSAKGLKMQEEQDSNKTPPISVTGKEKAYAPLKRVHPEAKTSAPKVFIQ
ncbi:hypothetical protein AS29_020090 [Bacillus sp. SJS]|nr:hypothetical protein AS29_020090 [Bacillus sp. SJS]